MPKPAEEPSQPPELSIVLDAANADALAVFWTQALGNRCVNRLGPDVVLVPAEGTSGAVFLVQAVT